MFGFFKNIVRKLVSTPADNEELVASEAWPEEEAYEEAPAPQYSRPAAPAQRDVAARKNGTPQSSRGIELPLEMILNGLPLELQPKIRKADVGDLSILVPLEKILGQLPRGSVKISFGELRQAAPGVFSSENDRDRVLVPLPLQEILARLNPALITRRRVQKRVEVPADITNPFDPQGQNLIFSAGPTQAEAEPAPALKPAPRPVPVQRKPAVPEPLTVGPLRNSISSTPTPPPPEATPPPAPSMVAAPRPVREFSSPAPANRGFVPAAPAAASEHPPLVVSLTSLAESWPEAIRKEIVEANLVDARVALPNEAVEQSLKQGRIAFSWRMLRSWIKPYPVQTPSAQDGLVLELPLKVVAPLFLSRQHESSSAQHKVSIDEDIPNLFFGLPQGESGSAALGPATPNLGRSAETNYYVWDDSADTVRVHESEIKRGPTPGTKFVAKYATPNEVVSRAASLDGVAGVLIALPDGLMVASRISSDVNGDTLAAFLPQIFGKVSQCTKELRMGELNNLNFTVGNVPWKIFRVNAIFFAAFGRAGEALPTAQLAALAAELDHKPK